MANTDVSAPFPQVDLQPLSMITVSLSDAGAKITKLTVHGWQEDPSEPPKLPSPVSGAYTTA